MEHLLPLGSRTPRPPDWGGQPVGGTGNRGQGVSHGEREPKGDEVSQSEGEGDGVTITLDQGEVRQQNNTRQMESTKKITNL